MEALKLKPLPFNKLFDKLEENVKIVEIDKPIPFVSVPGLVLFGIILTVGVIFAYQLGKGNNASGEAKNSEEIVSEKVEEVSENEEQNSSG